MKKIFASLLLFICSLAGAAPNDFIINQAAADGFSQIPRLTSIPSGGASGILIYNSTSAWPQLATVDSSLAISTGGVISVSSSLLSGKFNTPTGTTAQYLRGDGSLATFPTAVSAFSNDSAYVNQAGARAAISLTTTGSGAATYNSSTGVLNVPNNTAATPVQASATRSLNTAFQVSSTRWSHVKYAVQQTITASIAGGQNGDVVLEMASDSAFTTNVQTLDINGFGQTYTLAVALQGVQPQTTSVSGWVPPAYYVRIRPVNNTGTPAFLYRAGQELQL